MYDPFTSHRLPARREQDEALSFRMSGGLMRRVRAAAESDGVSLSEFIRGAVERAVETRSADGAGNETDLYPGAARNGVAE